MLIIRFRRVEISRKQNEERGTLEFDTHRSYGKHEKTLFNLPNKIVSFMPFSLTFPLYDFSWDFHVFYFVFGMTLAVMVKR